MPCMVFYKVYYFLFCLSEIQDGSQIEPMHDILYHSNIYRNSTQKEQTFVILTTLKAYCLPKS